MDVPNLTTSILNPTLSVISYFSNGQTIEGNKDLVETCEKTLDEVCTLKCTRSLFLRNFSTVSKIVGLLTVLRFCFHTRCVSICRS